MLIVPLTGKISWRNPPIVTIIIILINCLVWFVVQNGDTEKHRQASKFYFTSGLVNIEISYFIAYRDGRLDEPVEILDDHDYNEAAWVENYLAMREDEVFKQKLKDEEIITPAEPIYEEWKDSSTEYNLIRSDITSLHYGFIPAHKSWLTSFSHMFMHGSTGHLIGNMVFLWIFGCMLEMGLGRIKYSLLYLIGGLFAVWGFWLVHMHSTIPLVGASGAIAGLSGAFAVLFGKRKVKIFYSLGFYFNYLKIPAFILLPIWLGKELYQMLTNEFSNVAYMAHIGGIVGGALIGFIFLKLALDFDDEVIQDTPVDEISPLIEKALGHIAELDLDAGRKILESALAKEPNNTDVLTHLFNACKLDPESERFHQVTRKLILELTHNYNTYEKAHHIYNEYIGHTSHPRLPPPIYIQLSIMFAATGHLEDAVKIISMVLKKVPDSPGVPTALLKLAGAYTQKGMASKGNNCLKLLCSKYPESTEAQLARKSLQTSPP